MGSGGSLRRHLLDMGVIPGTVMEMVGTAPMGDPLEFRINGYSLSLRIAEARQITIDPARTLENAADGSDNDLSYIATLHEHNSHPGIGEEGRYHSKDHENPLPKGTALSFAIAGQHNSGKTTLFNLLTGSKQHSGHLKSGEVKGYPQTSVTDLPGFYSLSLYSEEELAGREFILNGGAKGIINLVDANNIERNLYLTVQLMELEIPMVLALNMMDEVRGNKGSVRVNEMERILGIPVVPISTADNEGIDELMQHAVHIAKYQEKPARQDFCSKDDHGGAVHRCLHGVMHLIEDHATAAGLPVRFAASKLIEGDDMVMKALNLTTNEKEMIEHIICQMEEERGLDRLAAMADMRYAFIKDLCAKTVVKPEKSREYVRSRRIDRILTGKWTALPVFIAVMALVIWLSIDVLGAPLQNLLQKWINGLADSANTVMDRWDVNSGVQSLVVDGLFGGVGTVVSFVPVIAILFFFLSILEDSGYMPRVAFVTDKLLRKIGLSGHSIVPLLIGLGCSVPGVLATRTLPSARDRKMTVLLTPFMSCSAKIPIYAFLAGMFFPGHGGLVLICLYLLGIFLGILVALATRHMGNRSNAAPFVMELPNYRLPQARNVGHLLWDTCKDFIQRAFSVILIASIIIWFLQSFNFRFEFVENGSGSILAAISNVLVPLFRPLGLDDWRIITALFSGFLAKESIVSTMIVLGAASSLTAVTAVPLLVFCLLYTPCVATITAVKRELGGKWALFMIVFQCLLAWLVAFAAYNIALLVA